VARTGHRVFSCVAFALGTVAAVFQVAASCEGTARAAPERVPDLAWVDYDGSWADGEPPTSQPTISPDGGSNGATAATKSVFTSNGCNEDLVLCLDVDGNTLARDDAGDGRDRIPVPRVGDVLRVLVIGNRAKVADETLVVTNEGALEPRKRSFATADGGTVTASERDEVLMETFISVPDTPAVRVRLQRLSPDGKVTLVDQTVRISVERRQAFHFEAILLVPVIPRGVRQVSATPRPGSNLRFVDVTEDARATIGLALNYFPFGICGNGPWASDGSCRSRGPREEDERLGLKRYLLQPLGLQVGTTLDFSRDSFREWYTGLAFEAVRGASLSFGFAYVRGRFLRPGYEQSGWVPDGDTDKISYERTMIRPYLGFGISPEIIGTLLSVLEQVKKIDPPDGTSR